MTVSRETYLWNRATLVSGLAALLFAVPAVAQTPPVTDPVDPVAFQQIFVDPATGRARQPTAEERAQMREAQRMLDRSVDALEPVFHPDGTISISLEGAFLNVAVVRLGDHGSLDHDCVVDAATLYSALTPLLPSRPLGLARPITRGPVSASTTVWSVKE
jgi:hypothetical protein